MPTSTTNYALQKPLVNNPTDQDLWGGELNTDLDNIDGLLKTAIQWLHVPKSASFVVTAPIAASTNTGDSKTLFLCDATGGAIVGTLPAAASCTGMTLGFLKTDNSANTLTVAANGAELIDGANTFVISSQYGYIVISCDGTKWYIISQTVPATPGRLLNIQVFTSSGTYTPTAGTNTIIARGIGGGGGGGSATGGVGSNGGQTSLAAILVLNGGSGGGAVGAPGGGGGTSVTATIGFTGSAGNSGATPPAGSIPLGGTGGTGMFGAGAGQGGGNSANGTNASTNSGAGGGGAGGQISVFNGSAGGGAGAQGILYVGSITGTYAVTIGGGGAGAIGTTSGGNGAAGVIIIEEYS